ncbi:HU family DNA-binding protein [Roseovarius sp. SCSIO 43702]|uniref:HU family DNA-binding protein n=1 Tax=Roseovarius sp. SCSIO 43702 TaxID=2823043 RepID=UPI001C73B00D|nr:HU family DNA-binding protein [Roseovarius sp. SCSIO 43702]QYX55314.1 HU family DNA-binding protein [Roseovarius sp. SCSIO 43702]
MAARKTTSSKAKKAPGASASDTRAARVPAPKPKIAPPRMNADAAPGADTRGDATDTAPGAPTLKKQELFKKVADRSGAKKNQVKPIVEAAMEVLGEALAQGRDLNLPPLGKIKQNRVKDNPNARVIVAKIRQPKEGAETVKDTVADAAE